MKIVFLGDSITDVGRNTEAGSAVSIGQGYPLIVSAKMSALYPGRYEFVNSAITGSRVVDVYARIKADCWNLKPDVISLLVGVNDVWHEVDHQNGVDAPRFEAVYRMLLADTLARLPKARFLLLEPFALNGSATKEVFPYFYEETRQRAESVRKLAQEFGQVFIPLQDVLDKASQNAPDAWYIADGVHPMPAGHYLIAQEWLKAFSKHIEPLR